MARRKHIVFLIHGIRTQAEWAERVAAILEKDPSIKAVPIRYGFLDIVRFLLPIKSIREKPALEIITKLRGELSRNPDYISIIAHSFGTYIVSKILSLEHHVKIHRLIVCGSIIPDDFNWDLYRHRLNYDVHGDWQVINDCGMNDIWPVFAKTVTWGYGSSGRFGFGHPMVKDRFFKHGHSGFFSESFIEKYWIKYISEGLIEPGILERPVTPWWLSLLTVIKVRNAYPFLLLVIMISSIYPFYIKNIIMPEPQCSWSPGLAFDGRIGQVKVKNNSQYKIQVGLWHPDVNGSKPYRKYEIPPNTNQYLSIAGGFGIGSNWGVKIGDEQHEICTLHKVSSWKVINGEKFWEISTNSYFNN